MYAYHLRYVVDNNVCVYCSVAGYHSGSIVREYLRYPIDISLSSSKTMDFFSPQKAPDFTICNLNPISSSYRQREGYTEHILSISRYAEIVRKYVDSLKLDSGKTVSDSLLTTHGYYQNIGPNISTILGHLENELIVSCHVELFDGFASQLVPCNRLVTITRTSYPAFFNCYTLSVPGSNYNASGAAFGGYELVLHIDNYDATNLSLLSSNQRSDFVGVLVVPHKRGTKAPMDRKTIFMPPGYYADLKISSRSMHRLGPPHGEECTDHIRLQYNERWWYTQLSCVSACVQSEVLKVRTSWVTLAGSRESTKCRLPFFKPDCVRQKTYSKWNA